MQECGAEALDNKVEFGIWGGMTERQRRALLKQHPEIVSWRDFFDKRNGRSVGQAPAAAAKSLGRTLPS
jgi:WhiB family transcriptional regulator, redox-sensing transcriptional regulator